MRNLVEQMKLVKQLQPIDSNGAAQGGNYNFVSLRNYQGGAFIVSVGAHSGSAAAFTINQAKNVEGNGSKAWAYDRYFSNLVGASPQDESDMWREFTGAAGTFNIVAQTNFVIPILPGALDVSNNFDCVRATLAAPDASSLISMHLLLWGGPEGITGNKIHIPSVNVNRMDN